MCWRTLIIRIHQFDTQQTWAQDRQPVVKWAGPRTLTQSGWVESFPKLLWLGTTVFCGTQDFEPSRGIYPFPRNFYVFLQNFTEFCIGWWLRDKYGIFWPGLRGRRKLITVCRCDCTVKYVTNIRALIRRNIENIELIWNIAFLFGRQTVSVSCDNLLATNTAIVSRVQGS